MASDLEESNLNLSNDIDDHFMSNIKLPGLKWNKTNNGQRNKAKVDKMREKAKKRTWKQYYDVTRKFQEIWVAKLPWNLGILRPVAFLHMVCCRICNCGRKECLMGPRWDTLSKHGIRECHKSKKIVYTSRQP